MAVDLAREPEWIPIETAPPCGPVLVFSDGTCVVATVVDGIGPDGAWRVFMDPRNDEILPSPTHWMTLPNPPRDADAS